ncbi:MAG: PAS domain S-box protein [Gammaproteobacteria bacterium]|nr:PAS domain S-box protein [Gammaproteobacteria bacterium]MBU3988028.1 PAS domain S-box protein [Gammaproteobacteria bacterium]MBU4005211.1 PAS domain S-box protein [Gammaproteobacteria bacterium]MBU4022390.1 PAS domain S-box protein [Gammaproteobacteria bacterium]MBU4097697.1 PAS domain S-box protein [Gammaproteobacteria bacterium]
MTSEIHQPFAASRVWRTLLGWPRWLVYAMAVALTLAMLFVQAMIAFDFDDHSLLILLALPIIISALFGGLGPGLLSTTIAAVSAAWHLPPAGIGIALSHDLFLWSTLITNGVLVSILAELLHRAHRQGEAARLAQAEKLHALQLLAAITTSSTDAIFAKDIEDRFIVFNRASERLTGKCAEDALGRDEMALFPPEIARNLIADNRRVMVEDRVITFQEVLVTPNGPRTYLTTKGPMHDAGGTVIGMFGTARDITDLKRAEAELRKLSLAVEQSPESVVITNVDAVIEYVNEAFLHVTGYAREDVIGQNPRLLHSGNTPPATYRAMWEALSRGKSWKGEFHNRRKDGSEYTEFAIVTPIRQPDGCITHYVAVKEDITEKKRLGEELDRHRNHLEQLVELRTVQLTIAQGRAEAANQAKSVFLANMSHEIRTPMNAIIGLTHLMRRAGATPEQDQRLEKIDGAGRHLLSIINDILDLSKIEAGRLQLESTDFHLSTILDNVASLISEQARAKGLTIEVDTDSNVQVWLRGDPTRLRQALLNYASNAVKFSEQGAIILRARLLEDSGDELLVRFEVQDSGIGIAADKQRDLFQAFEQADASTTRKYGGTGLGLAITRRLAQLMGGAVGIESKLGEGSTFWLTARIGRGLGVLQTAAAGETDVETQLRQRHGNARLLLAEDNLINREITLELLHSVGLAVDSVEDGREAVEQARAQPYDLILMDVQMPEMDGLDATRAIRALPGYATIPILAMTANAFDEDRRNCLTAGMDDFVPKPAAPAVLFAILLKWLRKPQAQPGGMAKH